MEVATAISERDASEDRVSWSPATTLLFVLLSCGGFWIAVLLGLTHLLH